MASARSAPMAVPNTRIQRRLETFRANRPMIAPAISPLNVDPTTMPIRPARTSGVNQALRPSRIPSAPPTRIPTAMRFMSPPGFGARMRPPSSLVRPDRILSAAGREKDDGAPREIREHDPDRDAMPAGETQRAAQQAFRPGRHGLAVEER